MDWSTWRPASCLSGCWCEAPRTGSWILEPVNTWTNLVFILAGFVYGLAFSCKISAILFAPVILLFVLYNFFYRQKSIKIVNCRINWF